MFKKLALVVGAILVLVGILGFVPALAPKDDTGMRLLLGIFMVGAVHNLIHIASGLGFLALSTKERTARLYFQIFGLLYAVVTVVGFIQGDSVLGLFHVNLADNFLHLGLSLLGLVVGFGLKPAKAAAQQA